MRCARYAGSFLFLLIALLSIPCSAQSPGKPGGPCSIGHPSDATVEWDCRTLRPTESLERLFGDQWIEVARFNRIDRRHIHVGGSIKVPRRLDDLATFQPMPSFYPPAEWDERFVLIDLSEQFLGAYEYGALRFSFPIASGGRHASTQTPIGAFRLSAAHRLHRSSLFTVEGSDRPYPMNYALRFHINREGVAYWIHGRDLPGYPASHGCIGLYDEPMQKEQYGIPKDPELNDAKRLFEWVFGGEVGDEGLIPLPNGPRVHIIGHAP